MAIKPVAINNCIHFWRVVFQWLQTYKTWLKMLLSFLQLTGVSIFNLSLGYHATLRNEDILEMLPMCYFWWMLKHVVLTMLFHVLTQGHNGRCCCLPSRLAASHVLQYFTSFVQLQFNFYHLLVACRYTCQWHWSTLRPGGTARLCRRWLWASFGQDEVPQQLPLRTYQVCTHQFNLTNTSCN